MLVCEVAHCEPHLTASKPDVQRVDLRVAISDLLLKLTDLLLHRAEGWLELHERALGFVRRHPVAQAVKRAAVHAPTARLRSEFARTLVSVDVAKLDALRALGEAARNDVCLK